MNRAASISFYPELMHSRRRMERRSSISINGHIEKAIEELDLSHDRDEFGNVGFLAEKELAVLTKIPDMVWQKHNLKMLTLKKNEIVELPEAISSLVNLEILNVSENELTKLPNVSCYDAREIQSVIFASFDWLFFVISNASVSSSHCLHRVLEILST